jgi:DNA-binding CsgD family transcriptional regulator
MRDPDENERLFALDPELERVVVGRRSDCDLVIDWDERVSRTHCELIPVGRDWLVTDDGLSRNGTFVNRERVVGRRRLDDHDVLRVGDTRMAFRSPVHGQTKSTVAGRAFEPPGTLTDLQRRILVALCRPVVRASGPASPATNEEIGREIGLSIDAVKAHLRVLFGKFAMSDRLRQNEKRTHLVRLAIDAGVVRSADYGGPALPGPPGRRPEDDTPQRA